MCKFCVSRLSRLRRQIACVLTISDQMMIMYFLGFHSNVLRWLQQHWQLTVPLLHQVVHKCQSDIDMSVGSIL